MTFDEIFVLLRVDDGNSDRNGAGRSNKLNQTPQIKPKSQNTNQPETQLEKELDPLQKQLAEVTNARNTALCLYDTKPPKTQSLRDWLDVSESVVSSPTQIKPNEQIMACSSP